MAHNLLSAVEDLNRDEKVGPQDSIEIENRPPGVPCGIVCCDLRVSYRREVSFRSTSCSVAASASLRSSSSRTSSRDVSWTARAFKSRHDRSRIKNAVMFTVHLVCVCLRACVTMTSQYITGSAECGGVSKRIRLQQYAAEERTSTAVPRT